MPALRSHAAPFQRAGSIVESLRLFHYSIGSHLARIIGDGQLNPSESFAGTQMTAVWLSANPVWEESVVKSVLRDGARVPLSKQEIIELGQGLVRFEVACGDHICTWQEFVLRSGLDADFARRLEAAGIKRGAEPTEWYAALRPIPRAEWRALSLWDTDSNEWQPVEL
ncbi:hypothetical protein [Sorangium sp. So ce385]|uniref:hypothetical protein n=1 Tax=Sorangium sp. So ce385 TaxID=3133308 RepID=UPI003F5C4E2A